MRTTITIPDELAQEAQALAGGRALSEFTREALRERVARLKREKLAREMEEGYRAMAQDENREEEALSWSEGLVGDVADEPR